MNQRADSLKKNLGKMWTPPRKNHQVCLLSHTLTTFAGIIPPEDWKTCLVLVFGFRFWFSFPQRRIV